MIDRRFTNDDMAPPSGTIDDAAFSSSGETYLWRFSSRSTVVLGNADTTVFGAKHVAVASDVLPPGRKTSPVVCLRVSPSYTANANE